MSWSDDRDTTRRVRRADNWDFYGEAERRRNAAFVSERRIVVGPLYFTYVFGAMNLISPNSPNTNRQLSKTDFPLTLSNNHTKLNSDGTWWASGDALLILLGTPVDSSVQLASEALYTATFPDCFAVLNNLLVSYAMGHFDIVTDFGAAGYQAMLYIQAITNVWDPATVSWNNFPACTDSTTDSAGVYQGPSAPNALAGPIFDYYGSQIGPDAAYSAVAGSGGVLTVGIPKEDTFSGNILSGSSASALKIDGYPFDSSGTQIKYNSQYNVAGNFIGDTIVITPYDDGTGRTAQTCIITGYAANGTISFTPALPWTPHTGPYPDIDTAKVYPKIYGFAIRVFSAPSIKLTSSGALLPYSCSFIFDSVAALNRPIRPDFC